MRKIINHLRKQPEEVRTHVLHVSTIALGSVLVLLWVYSLGSGFSATAKQASTGEYDPFSVLKANVIDGYNSISENVNNSQGGLQVDQ